MVVREQLIAEDCLTQLVDLICTIANLCIYLSLPRWPISLSLTQYSGKFFYSTIIYGYSFLYIATTGCTYYVRVFSITLPLTAVAPIVVAPAKDIATACLPTWTKSQILD